jgi:hypothetical protein
MSGGTNHIGFVRPLKFGQQSQTHIKKTWAEVFWKRKLYTWSVRSVEFRESINFFLFFNNRIVFLFLF